MIANLKKTILPWAGPVACAALGIWMLTFWFQTANDVRKQYLGYPTQDYWRSVVNLPRYEKWDLSVFWEQHNEHRVIVPELIYALDDRLFGAHEYLPLILSAIFQAGTFGLLAWVIWSDRKLTASLRLATIFICGLVLGWPGISYVISFPFLIQWTVVQFLTVAALIALTRRSFAIPIVCGLIATFSSGHGMFLWPVFLLAGLALRIGWKRLAIIAGTGAASVMLYFYKWVPSVDSQAHRFLEAPYWFFAFLASMMSMPFGADFRVEGLWIGTISFVVFCGIMWIVWKRRLFAEPPSIVLLGVTIFSLLTILVCGIGRTLPTYWDYPTAKVARYLSVPLSYWSALLAMTIWVAARTQIRMAWLATGLIAAGMAFQFPRIDPWLVRQFDFYSRSQSATLAMESGLTCDNLIGGDLYPAPANIHDWDPILKRRRLSIYAGDRFQWIGKPLAALMTISAPANGAVTTSIPFGCAVQLAGWLTGNERDLVLVNSQGVVAGLGRRLPAGLPLYVPNVWSKAAPKENWTAFAGYPLAGQTVQPYVVSANHRSASPLGSPISLPTSAPR